MTSLYAMHEEFHGDAWKPRKSVRLNLMNLLLSLLFYVVYQCLCLVRAMLRLCFGSSKPNPVIQTSKATRLRSGHIQSSSPP
jgi:hypothetical protein